MTRKRIIFIIIFFTTLVFVFFFLGIFSKVFAYQDETQLIYDTESENWVDSGGNYWFAQTLSTSTVWEAAETTFYIRIKNTLESSHTYKMGLWTDSEGAGFCGTADTITESVGAGETKFISVIWASSTIQTAIDACAFNSPASIRGFRVYASDYVSQFHLFGSANSASYPNGIFYKKGYPLYAMTEDANVKDAYFSISSEPSVSISIDFPENATSTPDFNYWGVSGYSNISPAVIHINWGASTSTWSGFTNYILDEIGEFNVSAPKSFTIPNGTYYATAWLAFCPIGYDLYSDCIPSTWSQPYGLGLFTPFATSTTITFTITGENPYTGGYYGTYYPEYTPTSTATSSEWVITCDPDDPLWSRSICQISKWTLEGLKSLAEFLFVPKQEDFARFGELKAELENKPPIGYFYVIKNAFNNLSSTSTPVFALESATSSLASAVYNPLKTGFTFILWLGCGIFVFNRIRYFDL